MKKKSLKIKFLQAMVCVLLFFLVLFLVMMVGTGTLRTIDQNFEKSLEKYTDYYKSYIEDELISRSNNVATSFNRYVTDIEGYMKDRKLTFEQLKNSPEQLEELLESLTDVMLSTININSITGHFIILDASLTSAAGNRRTGLYFSDSNPDSVSVNNADLLMRFGPSSISKSRRISLSSHWEYEFDFESTWKGKTTDYFDKPYEAAKQHPEANAQDLGYWSKPFILGEYDSSVVTYSVPLIGKDGTVYGVAGFEISANYLQRFSIRKYSIYDDTKTYLFIVIDEEGQYHLVEGSGVLFAPYGDRESSSFQVSNTEYDRVLRVTLDSDKDFEAYLISSDLRLYGNNSPFTGERWVFLSFFDDASITGTSQTVMRLLVFSLLFTLLAGLFVSYLTGSIITRPIQLLSESVQRIEPENGVTLQRTQIREIDNLAESIEILSKNVSEYASRTIKVIGMLNQSIGLFEYRNGGDTVYCTTWVLRLLGLESEEESEKNINCEVFQKGMERLTACPEPYEDHVYLIGKSCKSPETLLENTDSQWIKINIQSVDGDKLIGVIIDVTPDIMEKQKIKYERDYDVLTGLLNRRAFRRMLKDLEQPETLKTAAVMLWDLDSLKYVNDTYGHDMGDTYIKAFASVLSEFSGPHCIVSRMSGDEFYVVLYGFESERELRAVMGNLQQAVYGKNLKMPDGEDIKLRASAGYAWYPRNSDNLENLIAYADFAMYEVKRSLKGNVREFDHKTYDRDSFLLKNKEDLNKLIDNRLVRYALQPIVSLLDGSVFAYEALMRPSLKSLSSPLQVVRLAKSQSRLYDIEKLSVFTSLETYELSGLMETGAKLFLNTISDQTLDPSDIAILEDQFGSLLDKVVFEFTENEEYDAVEEERKLSLIQKWGAGVAVDDYGAGYNSEANLLALNPQYIKLDMSLIRDIGNDANRQQLVSGIVSYCMRRNIRTIAEGVENSHELAEVIRLGIDYVQGYYVKRPEFYPTAIHEEIVQEIRRLASEAGRKESR